jgi:type III restriction enzyme
MGYYVDRVVICDAYWEPDKHYQILPGGKSKLAAGRRPSMRFVAGGRDARGGIRAIVGEEADFFAEQGAGAEQLNDFVNQMRDEVRAWREGGYSGTSQVTRRVLEWWFERDEARRKEGKRLFYSNQEAIETVIYLYEVQKQRKMPETGDLIRYALKLATGTGKTSVMAALIVWATLHKAKVSGSPLSNNFLVLVPNLTVQDRVSGATRGDGLDPAGENSIYTTMDLVPPEYREEFRPNVKVINWQAVPLENRRDDWIGEDVLEEGRFVPAAVLAAMRRRAKQDPNLSIRKLVPGWRDCVILNDEAHHVWGEKRIRAGEDPEHIKWNKILERVSKTIRVGLVVDLSATPWYGSGSVKPEGTLFEWMVCDFSVYDAFESGLVKVVRLPDPDDKGSQYLDLWDRVKDAKTPQEYILGCKGAIDTIYSSWKQDFSDWTQQMEFARTGPPPVLLCVADNAKRAGWLFEHLIKNYEHLRNPDTDDRSQWVTVQIDSGVFEAEKGAEATIREMVNTVGKKGMSGEHVRCIVSVNMLSEGWDVRGVSHILGLRAFGSPLLTEQIIGRGLRRANYDVLHIPVEERGKDAEETVDVLGIPFVGFPVEKKRGRPRTGAFGGPLKPIEPDEKKAKYALEVPNVRAWAVGVTKPLHEVIDVDRLAGVQINPRETPPEVRVKPVVGGSPETVMTLDQFRDEWPLVRTAFLLAQEICENTNTEQDGKEGFGPTFEELVEVTQRYVERRIGVEKPSDVRDIGMFYWRTRARDILETAVRGAGAAGVRPMPILGKPDVLRSAGIRRFNWSAQVTAGKRCHLNLVPCHTPLEGEFADFLDGAADVEAYLKNERFGFSVTYFENGRPRQYYPDFVLKLKGKDGPEMVLAETKGEIRPNTEVKSQAARQWCDRMTESGQGHWRYLFVHQPVWEQVRKSSVPTLVSALEERLREVTSAREYLKAPRKRENKIDGLNTDYRQVADED